MAARPSLASVNPSLTCAICKGYLINAMTLIRCMHSFCKSCIHRHLDTSNTCPTCQQRAFRSRMDLHMVPDETMQSIVYKAVPGLYANEMRRRRDFYEPRDDRSPTTATGTTHTEDRGFPERVVFSEKDNISLVLEHRQSEPGSLQLCNLNLECPAATTISAVGRFVRNKFAPPASLAVHFYTEQSFSSDKLILDPDLRLIDVCYIAHYKLDAPLRLTFSFVHFKPSPPRRAATTKPLAQLESRDTNGLSNGTLKQISNGTSSLRGNHVQCAHVKLDRSPKPNSQRTLNSSDPLKTYSKAPFAASLSLALRTSGNESDSTEEEGDNWDSNVSTTIDSLTSQQKSAQKNGTLSTIVGPATVPSTLTSLPTRSTGPLSSSLQSPSALNQNAANLLKYNRPVVVAAKPAAKPTSGNASASMANGTLQGKLHQRDGTVTGVMSPNGVQHRHAAPARCASTGEAKTFQRKDRKVHSTATNGHQLGTKNGDVHLSSQHAPPAERKRPTVLKIKLNTSATRSETMTITSPPVWKASQSLLDGGSPRSASSATTGTRGHSPTAVTSIKIKPVVAPLTRQSPSPPTMSSRDARAAALDARKKRRLLEDDERAAAAEAAAAASTAAALEVKPKKSKKKSCSQAVINNAPVVIEQPKDLLGVGDFGWSSSVASWESQLRIPIQLTVPLTVSLARRSAALAAKTSAHTPMETTASSPSVDSELKNASFIEANFALRRRSAEDASTASDAHKEQQPQPRRRRYDVSPEVLVKLPSKDFKVSPTLRAVLDAIAASADSGTAAEDVSSPGTSSVTASTCASSLPPPALATKAESVNGDVKPSIQNGHHLQSTCASTNGIVAPTSNGSSHQELPGSVKFSINSILSGQVGQRNHEAPPVISNILPSPTTVPAHFAMGDVESSVAQYLSGMTRFFWTLDTCGSAATRSRLQEVCVRKKPQLGKILETLRSLSLLAAPNQLGAVLDLINLIQKCITGAPLEAMDTARVGDDLQVTSTSSAGVQRAAAKTGQSMLSTTSTNPYLDVNRNQMHLDAVVPSAVEQSRKPNSVSTAPSAVRKEPPVTVELKKPHENFSQLGLIADRQLHELILTSKENAAVALQRCGLQQASLEPKTVFEIIGGTIKRSSSVSSLNTSDGSETFGDCEIEPHPRWEGVEVTPPRPWPGSCTSEA